MKLLDGLLAGAAGTLALDTVSYLDMAIRARPASRTPEESVRRLAERAHVDLGAEERAANRRAGLGPLLGYAAGTATAVAVTSLTGRRRLPAPVAAALLTGAAMVATSAPMTALGITDPRRWSRTDWLSDIVPHLAYGAVTSLTWQRLQNASGRR